MYIINAIPENENTQITNVTQAAWKGVRLAQVNAIRDISSLLRFDAMARL